MSSRPPGARPPGGPPSYEPSSGEPATAEYRIRASTEADVPAFVRMKTAAWRQAYGHLREEAFFAVAEAGIDAQTERWRELLRGGLVVWVAEDEAGQCVGMATAGRARQDRARQHPPRRRRPDLPETELTTLYVLAGVYGTGLADQLMDRAVGDRPAHLWVLAENPRAQAFYRRHGFVPEGQPVPMDGDWTGLQEQLMVRRTAAPAER